MAESLFVGETPAGSFSDATTYELGLAWKSAVDGTWTGIRVYGPSTSPSSCVVTGWAIDSSVSGTLLETKTAGSPLTPGAWNDVLFDDPVPVAADIYYRAQTRTPDWYTHTASRFTSGPVTVGNLTAIQDNVEPPGDPYRNCALLTGTGYAAGGASGAWFGIDVLFVPDTDAASSTATGLGLGSAATGSKTVTVGAVTCLGLGSHTGGDLVLDTAAVTPLGLTSHIAAAKAAFTSTSTGLGLAALVAAGKAIDGLIASRLGLTSHAAVTRTAVASAMTALAVTSRVQVAPPPVVPGRHFPGTTRPKLTASVGP